MRAKWLDCLIPFGTRIDMAKVSTQAIRNFASVFIGTGAGALNTLVVLPWAFSSSLADWGLVRVITAWALLFSPIALFGASTTMVRFSPRFNSDDKARLAGLLTLPAIVLLALFGLVLAAAPEQMSVFLGVKSSTNIWWLYALTVLISVRGYLGGFLATRLKTSGFTFFRESFVKLGYLIISLLFGWGTFNFQTFLIAYVGIYAASTAAVILQAWANQISLKWRGFSSKTRREIMAYAGGIILAGSASNIVLQIDVLMVGHMLGLEAVPVFTIALFIGAVVLMPAKSWEPVLRPIVAEAFTKGDVKELERIHSSTHHMLLLSSGWVLVCVMASMPQIDALLPLKFQGLASIVLVSGLAKWVLSLGGGSRYILAQSPQYRSVIWINWGMVVAVIPLNYWFMHPGGLDLGIFGAAAASLAVICSAETVRQILLHRYLKIHTFTWRSILTSALLGVIGWGGWSVNPELSSWGTWAPWIIIAAKSFLATAAIASAAWAFNLAPELVAKYGRRKA